MAHSEALPAEPWLFFEGKASRADLVFWVVLFHLTKRMPIDTVRLCSLSIQIFPEFGFYRTSTAVTPISSLLRLLRQVIVR